MRDIGGVGINKMVFVVLVIGVSIICKYETLVSLITFTLPLMYGLPGNYFLPVWVLLVISKLARHGEFRESKAVLFVVVIFIAEILHYAFYKYDVDSMQLVGYTCSLLLVAIFSTNNKDMDYSIPVISFCIGCCVLLFLIYLLYIQNPQMIYSEGGVRMGGDIYKEDGAMTLATNANNVGYFSSACIACVMALFYYRKINIIAFFMILATSLYCGMFSVSRSWLITIALIFAAYFFFNKENRKYGYLMFGILFLVVFYYLRFHPEFLNMFIDRFTGDDIETGGQRTTLFAEYNKYLGDHFESFLFGTGALIYKEVTGVFNSTHNGLQQIWVSYGIIGFLYFSYFYYKVLKQNYTSKHYMAVMPMLAIAFFLQTIQVLNPHNGMYPLIVAFFIMKMVKQESSQIY